MEKQTYSMMIAKPQANHYFDFPQYEKDPMVGLIEQCVKTIIHTGFGFTVPYKSFTEGTGAPNVPDNSILLMVYDYADKEPSSALIESIVSKVIYDCHKDLESILSTNPNALFYLLDITRDFPHGGEVNFGDMLIQYVMKKLKVVYRLTDSPIFDQDTSVSLKEALLEAIDDETGYPFMGDIIAILDARRLPKKIIAKGYLEKTKVTEYCAKFYLHEYTFIIPCRD